MIVEFFKYLALAVVLFGATALLVCFAFFLVNKLSAGDDTKAATSKAWIVTGFAIFFLVLGVWGLAERGDLWFQIRTWGVAALCAFQARLLWQNARRMKDSRS